MNVTTACLLTKPEQIKTRHTKKSREKAQVWIFVLFFFLNLVICSNTSYYMLLVAVEIKQKSQHFFLL